MFKEYEKLLADQVAILEENVFHEEGVRAAKKQLKDKEATVSVDIALGNYPNQPSKNAEQRAAIVTSETIKEQENVAIKENAINAHKIKITSIVHDISLKKMILEKEIAKEHTNDLRDIETTKFKNIKQQYENNKKLLAVELEIAEIKKETELIARSIEELKKGNIELDIEKEREKGAGLKVWADLQNVAKAIAQQEYDTAKIQTAKG